MFYTELTFHISPYVEDIADAIIAELGDLGYDSFSYSDDGFKAYIPSKNFNEEQVKSLEILSFFQSLYTITWEKAEIENQDWNKIWEENSLRYPRARPDSGKSRIPSTIEKHRTRNHH
ncbi:MAG: hypothetical protein ACLU4N_23700 [Butyricimonas faecihominis]